MKITFTILFLGIFKLGFGQNYIPIPDSDAVWIQASYLIGANGHEHSTITNPLSFGQDTIVSSQTYHKLQGHQIIEWVDGWGNTQAYATGISTVNGYEFLFRQDISAKKVYTYFDNQDTLLYDFDLTVGQIYPQTVMNLNYPNLLVMGVDSVQLLDGLYHKKWLLGTDSMDSGYVELIEGVGSTMGFSLPIWPLFEQTGATLCFKSGSTQIYENWDNQGLIQAQYSEQCEANLAVNQKENNALNFRVYPNPNNGSFRVSNDANKLVELQITDLMGREVFSTSDFSNGEELTIDVHSGTYIVLLKDENQIYQQKITIE